MLYGTVDLEQITALLSQALNDPDPAKRLRSLDQITALLEAQATKLAPPPIMASLLEQATTSGIVATTGMITPLVVVGAFAVPPYRALEVVAANQARFQTYFKQEPKRFAVEAGKVVLEALQRGQSVQQAARALRDRVAVSRTRATLIAQNEIAHAMTTGQHMAAEAAEETGLTMLKTWVATRDSRTRDSHKSLDGRTIPMAEDFKAGLGRPHDPRAPASETIRCRCVLKYLPQVRTVG